MANEIKQPIDLFEEAYRRVIGQVDSIKVDEAFWHKLIAIRTDLHVCFNQLQYINPADKVKIHNKIADIQLWALKIG